MERGRRPGYILNQRDLDWLDEAVAWQWEMPKKAGPFWRRWGVRHVRSWWWVLSAYVYPPIPNWREIWRREWVSYAIRRGWC